MKQIFSLFCLLLSLSLCVCALADGAEKSFMETLSEEMSAFEITAAHRSAAPGNAKGYPVLDAGRGNPNWINTQSRYAFLRMTEFALSESEHTMSIGTPIFTPYLEIPNIEQYSLLSVDITATAETGWDIPAEELDKLADPSVKAFFLVNPSNPAARALSHATLDKLAEVVEKNPNLLIITDDVYATFTRDFESVYARLPHNTILVYSFSKLYGVTGWRIGLIAMNERNVCDQMLSQLSAADKASLAHDYVSVMPDISNFKMIDRMVADSRSIGLYHTAGLSTPSQAFMDMLAMTHLLCEEDAYIQLTNEIVGRRYNALMNALGLPSDESGENSRYYTLIDVNALMRTRYGDDFADWMTETVGDLNFLTSLATQEGVVLMYGPGFDAPAGNVRVSLANLNEESYVEIARRLFELIDDYYEQYSADALASAA